MRFFRHLVVGLLILLPEPGSPARKPRRSSGRTCFSEPVLRGSCANSPSFPLSSRTRPRPDRESFLVFATMGSPPHRELPFSGSWTTGRQDFNSWRLSNHACEFTDFTSPSCHLRIDPASSLHQASSRDPFALAVEAESRFAATESGIVIGSTRIKHPAFGAATRPPKGNK